MGMPETFSKGVRDKNRLSKGVRASFFRGIIPGGFSNIKVVGVPVRNFHDKP